jgi:hypothetical protein
MGEGQISKIILHHVTGSKANAVQEFSLEGRKELRFGRDASSDVAYDAVLDDQGRSTLWTMVAKALA